METAVQESKISALFWGSKKSVEPKELNVSLQDSILTGSGLEVIFDGPTEFGIFFLLVLAANSNIVGLNSGGVWKNK